MTIMIDDIISKLSLSKSEEIVFYILRHTDGDTKIFSKTYKQIKKDLNVSEPMIARVLKTLESNGTIIRAGVGKWFVPAVIGYAPDDEGYHLGIYAADD